MRVGNLGDLAHSVILWGMSFLWVATRNLAAKRVRKMMTIPRVCVKDSQATFMSDSGQYNCVRVMDEQEEWRSCANPVGMSKLEEK